MEVWRFGPLDPELGALLTGQHDPWLVGLSIVIACFAGLTSLALADRMLAAYSAAARAGWHIGGALAMGCGVWATHFTGMLAFSIEGYPRMEHALGLTLLSWLPAVLGSGAALYCMAQPQIHMPRLALGALLLVLGIGSMHYLGMEAMMMESLHYDVGLFVLSIPVAFMLALAALYLHFRLPHQTHQIHQATYSIRVARLAAAGCMGLAVIVLHYMGMAGTRFYDIGVMDIEGVSLSRAALAVVVGGGACTIMALGLLAAWVDRQKSLHRKLEGLANTDALTGLPNRLCFHECLEAALAESRREGKRLAVLFMDLDGFKSINDTLGHAAGDQVLQAFAARLSGTVRKADIVARFGGDEFVILMQGGDLPEAAAYTARRLLRAMEAPIGGEEWTLDVNASIGISVYPDDSDYLEGLLQHADTAMYRAKQDNGGYHFFDQTLTERVGLRRAAEDKERHEALETGAGQEPIHYQPRVELSSGRWMEIEALVGWSDTCRARGARRPLRERELTRICQQGRCWLDEGREFGRLTVNIEAALLVREGFVVSLWKILADSALPARYLELEISEPSLIRLGVESLERLREIQGWGVSVVIGGFSSGGDCLRQLKVLSVDTLKLEQGFVQGILDDPRDRAIVCGLVAMADGLGAAVLAGGLASAAQAACAKALGCRYGQGDHFGPPMLAADLTHRLPLVTESRQRLLSAAM